MAEMNETSVQTTNTEPAENNTRTFTQDEVSALCAREAGKAERAILKQLGLAGKSELAGFVERIQHSANTDTALSTVTGERDSYKAKYESAVAELTTIKNAAELAKYGVTDSEDAEYYAFKIGKMVSKSWNDVWKNISSMFKTDTKKKTGPGDARTLPVLQTAIKPNIYLYPTEEADVEVRFKNPELLTTVIPEYKDSWQATAQPDGSLTVDGEEYGFLFYESDTSVQYMQRNEGWIIKPETRERQLSEIAAQYAFNKQETEDFVTFWCARLENDISYIMYPQHTETIDALMPVDISPAPNSIFRVWFLFDPITGDIVSPPEPRPNPIERAGFTVTEWGGIVTEETKSSRTAK